MSSISDSAGRATPTANAGKGKTPYKARLLCKTSRPGNRCVVLLLTSVPLVGCSHRASWSDQPDSIPVAINPPRDSPAVTYGLEPQAVQAFTLPTTIEGWGSGISGDFLEDGGAAVTDGKRFAFYAADGSLRATLGREGSGPGEFQNVVASCVTAGDTLIAHDMGRGTFSVIDSKAGQLVRVFSDSIGTMLGNWCFSDGSFLVARSSFDPSTRSEVILYRRLRTDGHPVSTIRSVDLPRAKFLQTGSPKLAAAGERWAYVDPYFSEAIILDTSGTPLRLVRTRDAVHEVSWQEAFRARGIEVAAGTPQRSGAQARKSRSPFWVGVLLDPSGQVWLQEPPDPEKMDQSWSIFDTGGRLRGRFALGSEETLRGTQLLSVFGERVLIRRTAMTGRISIEIRNIVIVDR